MKKNYFESNRFELEAIRCYSQGKTFILSQDFQIVNSNHQPGTYAGLKKSGSMLCVKEYGLKLLSKNKDGIDAYEMDIVQYDDGKGVICYDQEHFMWVVANITTKAKTPLWECHIEKVLGSVYADPDIITAEEKNYEQPHLPVEMPGKDDLEKAPREYIARAETRDLNAAADTAIHHPSAEPAPDYVAVDELVPWVNAKYEEPVEPLIKDDEIHVYVGVYKENSKYNWSFKIESTKKTNEKHSTFNKTGDAQYYITASCIIALAELGLTKKRVILHTPYKKFNDMINNNKLAVYEALCWTNEDGRMMNNAEHLQTLKSIIDKLPSVKAKYTEAKKIMPQTA